MLEQLSVDDLDTVIRPIVIKVNTASRSSKPIGELPITSYVISKETIMENNYRTLIDVLKNVPGVRVSQPGDSKTGETFTINGLLGNYYTKILITGIPITPSGAPGMPISGQLPIRQAERIEIITNPSTAIYGADAMGGVINIITEQSQKRATYGNVILSVGDYGYNEINMMLGGKIGRDDNILKYNFIANHSGQSDINTKNRNSNLYNINNYIHIDTLGLGNNPLFEGTAEQPYLGNMPNEDLMLAGEVEYKSFKFSIFHLSRGAHNAIGNLPYYSSYQLPDTSWGERVNRYSMTYELARKKFNSQTTISYEKYRMNNGSSELIVNSLLGFSHGLKFKYGASDDLLVDQLFNFMIDKKSNIVLGASYTYSGNLPVYQNMTRPFALNSYRAFSDHLKSNEFNYYILSQEELNDVRAIFGEDYTDFTPFNYSQFGLFTQYEYSNEKFRMLLDLRYDYHSLYGSNINPRLSFMYNVTSKFSIKSTYTKAFKSPSTYHKYYSYVKHVDSDSYIPFPNSKLENERVQALELGIVFSPSNDVRLELLSNYSKRSNEIVFSFSNPDIDESIASKYSYYGYVNNRGSGSANFTIQAIANIKDLVPSIKLDLDGSVTYQRRTETTNVDLLRYDTYRVQPDFIFNINVHQFYIIIE